MTTTIGSVTLDRDMIWEDEYLYNQTRASVEQTTGGGVCIQEFEGLESGRPITLVSTDSQGYQRKSIVDALRVLADIANSTYSLIISSNGQTVTKTVRFVNETSGGPIQFDPFHPREGIHSSTIYYKGQIYLMVV